MFSVINLSELIESNGCTLAFECANQAAQNYSWWISQQEVDVVFFAVKFHNLAVVFERDLFHTGLDKVSLHRSEYMPSKFRTKHDMHGQVVNTVACAVKVKISDTLAHRLDSLLLVAVPCIKRMLNERHRSSSKYYPELPCVVSKSLIAKYQRNLKCRSVSNVVIPICGDKERQIKLEKEGVRIPALFGKDVIPVTFPWPVYSDEKGRHNVSVEFFHRGGEWFGSFIYRTPPDPQFQPVGAVGVDRNSVGHVATMADPQTGKVLHLGFNPAPTKAVWRGRKAKLQRQRRNRLLCKIKRKQSRRTKHENHIVSKVIVDYAATHRRAIVLENLENIRAEGSKIRSYTERSQWSFFQLNQYIQYKAALRGVEVVYIAAAYTSQECSRCHAINKPTGKKYACANCGHNDHRDANAAFSIAQRGTYVLRDMPTDGIARHSEWSRSGILVDPFPGSADESLGPLRLMTCQ